MLEQHAAGLGGDHALAIAHQKRRPKGFFKVANAGAGGAQRQMRALGPVRDAARLDHITEQVEVDQG